MQHFLEFSLLQGFLLSAQEVLQLNLRIMLDLKLLERVEVFETEWVSIDTVIELEDVHLLDLLIGLLNFLRDNLRINVNQLILGELLLFELHIQVKHLLNLLHCYIGLALIDKIFLGLVPLHNLSKDTVKLFELDLCFIHEFQGNHGEHSCGSEAVLPIDGVLALMLEVEIQFMLGDEHLDNLLADQVEIVDSIIGLVLLF